MVREIIILVSYLGILVSTGRGGSFPEGLSKRERVMKEDEKRIFDVRRRGRGRGRGRRWGRGRRRRRGKGKGRGRDMT